MHEIEIEEEFQIHGDVAKILEENEHYLSK